MATYKVTSYQVKPLQFGLTGVPSILQNISIILATRVGTVPMYRAFGTDQSWVDRPIPVAKNLMFNLVKEAIEKYEPRAEVVDMSFTHDHRNGKLVPTVEVNIKSE